MNVTFLKNYKGALTQERLVLAGAQMSLPTRAAVQLSQKGVVSIESEPQPFLTQAILPYRPLARTPVHFRVVATMQVYNEADVLDAIIRRAIAEGVELVIYDNWSTDGSYEIALAHIGKGVLSVKRWPDAPVDYFSHDEYAAFVTKELMFYNDAAWHMCWDADELLLSCWQGVPYRDALYAIDQMGYTCVDHSYLDFWAMRGDFTVGDPVSSFVAYEVRDIPLQRAWKAQPEPVDMEMACHRVHFPQKKIAPFMFVLRNYRYRSPAQARAKQLARQQRKRAELASQRGAKIHLLDANTDFMRPPHSITLRNWDANEWTSRPPFAVSERRGQPESTWTQASDWCPDPSKWSATDNYGTEHEVTELVAAFVRATQPSVVVESGTYHGETAVAIGRALQANGHGVLYTLENDEQRAEGARDACRGLPVKIIVQDVMKFVAPEPVDFAWIDSSPDRLTHLAHVVEQCRDGAIVGMHDTAPHHKPNRLALPRGTAQLTLHTPRGVTFFEVTPRIKHNMETNNGGDTDKSGL